MTNDPNGATAEGLSDNITLNELLVAYVEEASQRRKASMAYDAAYASMPAWAQAGPKLLLGDGTFSKQFSGWPEVETLPAPSGSGVLRVIRPSIRDAWKHRTMLLGPKSLPWLADDDTPEGREIQARRCDDRRRIRLAAFASVRRVIARRRLQEEERRKAGVCKAAEVEKACCDRLDAIEARIRATATADALSGLAADALMEARYL